MATETQSLNDCKNALCLFKNTYLCTANHKGLHPLPTQKLLQSHSRFATETFSRMKKLSFTVNSLLALVVAAAISACSEKSAPQQQAVSAAPDTTVAAAAAINIRFIDADSVMKSYTLAQQLMEEQQRETNRLQQWYESKQRELQGMANNIGQKQQNNVYLSQASMDQDMQAFQKKGQEAESYFQSQQQRLANSNLAVMQRLTDTINAFVKDYNATRGYDAILYKESAVFFNPSLDITAEVIEGLNKRFEASSKK